MGDPVFGSDRERIDRARAQVAQLQERFRPYLGDMLGGSFDIACNYIQTILAPEEVTMTVEPVEGKANADN